MEYNERFKAKNNIKVTINYEKKREHFCGFNFVNTNGLCIRESYKKGD